MSTRRGERYSEDEIETIRRMAGEGRTGREIARALGRPSSDTIRVVRATHGIPSGQMRRYTPAEDVAIREAVATGSTSREIAEELGRTAAAIQIRRSTELVDAPHRGPRQIAAEARREAHIARLRERKAARRAAEKMGVEA